MLGFEYEESLRKAHVLKVSSPVGCAVESCLDQKGANLAIG